MWGYAMDTDASISALVEHRLIPARARSEGARLRRAGQLSICSPASQDSGHVGHAGIGVVSLRGAPLSLSTFATTYFIIFCSGQGLFGVACLLALGGLCTWLGPLTMRN